MKIWVTLDKVEPVLLRRMIVVTYIPLITPVLMIALGLLVAIELIEECW